MTQQSDFGARIRAARAYRGLSRKALADGLSMTSVAIETIEVGLAPFEEESAEHVALREAVAAVLALPEQFFTVDFTRLASDGAPSGNTPGAEVSA